MFNTVKVLGTSIEVDDLAMLAEIFGSRVTDKCVWNGIVPPDSFIDFGLYRMSRPEYMAFRKSNQLGHAGAVFTVAALLSDLDTSITSSVPAGCYYRRNEPNMTVESMKRYLEPVMDTEEGRKAAEILEEAEAILPDLISFYETYMEELDD